MNQRGRRWVLQIKRPTWELFFAVYLCMPYLRYIFNCTIRAVLSNTYKIDTLFTYAVLLLLFIATLNDTVKRIKAWQILALIIDIAILLLASTFSADSSTHVAVIKTVILSCAPMFILGACIRDYDQVYHYLQKIMMIIPYGYGFLTLILGIGTLTQGRSYSQSDAYVLLFPAIVLLNAVMNQFSIKYLIPMFICCFLMFAYGARGPIACFLLYIIFYLVCSINRENAKKNLKRILLVTAFGVPLIIYYREILLWCSKIFTQLGFSLRNIDKLLNSAFLEDKGRNHIFEICFDRIKTNPFLGTGPVNDRIYIAQALNKPEEAIGNYPHNFFIELLMQYGVFIGGIAIILVLFLIWRSVYRSTNRSAKELTTIFTGTYFFPLFFSGSYVDSEGFYLLVALTIAICLQLRRDKSMVISV